MASIPTTLVAALACCAPLSAQGISVALLGADDPAAVADCAALLAADPRIGSTSSYDVISGVPTIPTLQAHDVVVIWRDSPDNFLDPFTLGDNLAQFVAGGGGVVECYESGSFSNALGGAWAGTYAIPAPFSLVSFLGSYTLGTVHDPNHPAMAGVATVATASGGHHSYALNAWGQSIADWDDGRPLVAANVNSAQVLYLNNIPVSEVGDPNQGMLSTSDGPLLLANCVAAVAPPPPPVPTLAINGACPGNGVLDLFYMTPGGTCIVAWSTSQAAWAVPGGPACVGTVISIASPTIALSLTADASGGASTAVSIPAGACGQVHVIGFDKTTCTETNVVSL